MSYKITNTFTRPNKDVVFHISNVPDSYVSHVIENYKTPGKVTDITTEVTGNGLILTVIWVWANQAEYEAFLADPVAIAQAAAKDAHNAANGITATQTAEEV